MKNIKLFEMKKFDEFEKTIRINESKVYKLNEQDLELTNLGEDILTHLEDNKIKADLKQNSNDSIDIVVGGETYNIKREVPSAKGSNVNVDDIKQIMYSWFNAWLNNYISDEELVNSLKRKLGSKWFRFFKGDTIASDWQTVQNSMKTKNNREFLKKNMQIALDEKSLEIYDRKGTKYAKGSDEPAKPNGFILSTKHNKPEILNADDLMSWWASFVPQYYAEKAEYQKESTNESLDETTRFKTYPRDEAHRMTSGYSYEGGPDKKIAGNFELSHSKSTTVFYNLDDFDKNFTKDVPLKNGEEIFRYQNETTRAGKLIPLIKINKLNGLVYFNVADPDTEEIKFATKGQKATFMNIISENLKPLTKEDAEKTDSGEEGDMIDTTSSGEFNYSFTDNTSHPGGFLITTKKSNPYMTDYVSDSQIIIYNLPVEACNQIIEITKDLKKIEKVFEILEVAVNLLVKFGKGCEKVKIELL